MRQKDYRLNLTYRFSVLIVALLMISGLFKGARSIGRDPVPVNIRPHVLEDTSGQIMEVVVNLPSDHAQEVLPVLEQLLTILPEKVHLKICCSDDAYLDSFIHDCRWLFDPQKRRSDIIVSGLRLTPWARDRRIPRTDAYGGARSSLIPPAKPWHGADRRDETRLPFLMHQLKLAPDYEPLPCFLDGGNMVSDAHHAFIGGNQLAIHGLEKAHASELEQMLEHFLGKKVFFVHGRRGEVPWSHLDMFFTVLPGRKALVASHTLARKLISDASVNSSKHAQMLRETTFYATTQALLDDVAHQLMKGGYQVTRIPGIPNPAQQWFLTYNNVLMDFRHGQSFVIMPTYNMPEMDAYAASVYRDHGFEIQPIHVSSLYQEGGAIRCFANVTRRQPDSLVDRHETMASPGHLRIHRIPAWESTDLAGFD